MTYPGQSPSGITFPQAHGLSVGPQVRGQARLPLQPGSPRPRDSLTPAFSGRSGSHAPAPKTKQRSRNIGPQTPRGEGSTPWGFRPAAPGPPGPAGVPKGGGIPVPPEAALGPSPRGAGPGSLPVGDRLARQVWPGPPWSSPYVPCSRPWVNRSQIPSTHSVFRLLPEAARARDRKFGRPPRTHPLSCLQAERGAAGRPGLRCRARARTQGAVVSHLPLILYRPSGLRGLQSPQNGSVHSRRDVTASLPRRTGPWYLSAEVCASYNAGENGHC